MKDRLFVFFVGPVLSVVTIGFSAVFIVQNHIED